MRHLRPALMAALLLGGLAGSTPAAVGFDVTDSQPAASLPAQMPRSLYISGHSLTDRPFPDYLAAMAGAGGPQFDWDMQHQFGSALQDRTRGADGGDAGYRSGVDRRGEPADALAALERAPPYDALLLAEQHSLLESLIWKAMIPSAADYVRRFRAASPDGRAYLFAAWLNVEDPGDPRRWIAYERAAGPVWRCAAARIAQVADAPVTVVPAAEALALLVERTSAGLVPGLGVASGEAAIFTDDVHLTPAGSYYVALVTQGVLFGDGAAETWAPEGLKPETAAALREVARAFRDLPVAGEPDVEACRAYVSDRFAAHYLAYVRDARWRREAGLSAYVKWGRFRLLWPALFRGTSPDNPFAPPDGA